MSQRLIRFLRDCRAATAVEYAVMLALILMMCFAAIAVLGQKANQSWSNSKTSLEATNFGS